MQWQKIFGPIGLGLSLLPLGMGLVGRTEPEVVQEVQADKVIFTRDVLRVLKATCVQCHGPDRSEAGLRLDSYEAIMKGSAAGEVVVAGASAESELIGRLRGEGGVPQMPMGFRPLEEKIIATIERWIDDGAEESGKNYLHWSFAKPVRGEVPSVKLSTWPINEIDYFVLARLEAEGLRPSVEAPRSTLVRRVYLDVLGIPPTVEEANQFLADELPGAYERMVERVFASPHYGERQARIWLDLARYADSQGYEKDANRSMWPWRDWVIKAFNRNMRFDDFTADQFAGDLLSDGDMDKLVATGFHRNTMINEEGGVDQGEARWLTLVDRVGTVGTTWLGTTLACAQCHDHKYDPISHREFFQFLAFFENTVEPEISVTPKIAARQAELRTELADVQTRLKSDLTLEFDKVDLEVSKKGIEAELGKLHNVTTLVLKEKPDAKAETPMRDRGVYLSAGELVPAGTPEFLGPPAKSRDRLGLAQWLTSAENPMTSRVQVNRFWEQHFGAGLVRTSENFGTQGELPSHPELLDWLAVEFVETGWDMKAMHKKIVLSATYRQDSAISTENLELDPENRLLARGPRYRLEAEALRDSVFAVSGLLTRKIGGASVMPVQPAGIWNTPYNSQQWVEATGENRYRRSLYTFIKRSAPFPMLLTFDGTSREVCSPRRIRTNTPLQALNFLNDPGLLEGAVSLAGRVRSADVEAGVRGVVQRCLIREASLVEVRLLGGLFERTRAKYAVDLPAAAKVCGSPDAELAAWTMVVNTVMNTDEFLTLE